MQEKLGEIHLLHGNNENAASRLSGTLHSVDVKRVLEREASRPAQSNDEEVMKHVSGTR